MIIYLTKDLGAFKNAIYLPKSAEGRKVICPEIDSDGYSNGACGRICFFPEHHYLFDREFERRIKNPYDEDNNHLLGNDWLHAVWGRFIAIKQKEKISLSQQSMLEKIKKIYDHPTKFASFSEEDLKKNRSKVRGELEKRIETLDFLEEYDDFFQKIYSEAKWVGISEKIKDAQLITKEI